MSYDQSNINVDNRHPLQHHNKDDYRNENDENNENNENDHNDIIDQNDNDHDNTTNNYNHQINLHIDYHDQDQIVNNHNTDEYITPHTYFNNEQQYSDNSNSYEQDDFSYHVDIPLSPHNDNMNPTSPHNPPLSPVNPIPPRNHLHIDPRYSPHHHFVNSSHNMMNLTSSGGNLIHDASPRSLVDGDPSPRNRMVSPPVHSRPLSNNTSYNSHYTFQLAENVIMEDENSNEDDDYNDDDVYNTYGQRSGQMIAYMIDPSIMNDPTKVNPTPSNPIKGEPYMASPGTVARLLASPAMEEEYLQIKDSFSERLSGSQKQDSFLGPLNHHINDNSFQPRPITSDRFSLSKSHEIYEDKSAKGQNVQNGDSLNLTLNVNSFDTTEDYYNYNTTMSNNSSYNNNVSNNTRNNNYSTGSRNDYNDNSSINYASGSNNYSDTNTSYSDHSSQGSNSSTPNNPKVLTPSKTTQSRDGKNINSTAVGTRSHRNYYSTNPPPAHLSTPNSDGPTGRIYGDGSSSGDDDEAYLYNNVIRDATAGIAFKLPSSSRTPTTSNNLPSTPSYLQSPGSTNSGYNGSFLGIKSPNGMNNSTSSTSFRTANYTTSNSSSTSLRSPDPPTPTDSSTSPRTPSYYNAQISSNLSSTQSFSRGYGSNMSHEDDDNDGSIYNVNFDAGAGVAVRKNNTNNTIGLEKNNDDNDGSIYNVNFDASSGLPFKAPKKPIQENEIEIDGSIYNVNFDAASGIPFKAPKRAYNNNATVSNTGSNNLVDSNSTTNYKNVSMSVCSHSSSSNSYSHNNITDSTSRTNKSINDSHSHNKNINDQKSSGDSKIKSKKKKNDSTSHTRNSIHSDHDSDDYEGSIANVFTDATAGIAFKSSLSTMGLGKDRNTPLQTGTTTTTITPTAATVATNPAITPGSAASDANNTKISAIARYVELGSDRNDNSLLRPEVIYDSRGFNDPNRSKLLLKPSPYYKRKEKLIVKKKVVDSDSDSEDNIAKIVFDARAGISGRNSNRIKDLYGSNAGRGSGRTAKQSKSTKQKNNNTMLILKKSQSTHHSNSSKTPEHTINDADEDYEGSFANVIPDASAGMAFKVTAGSIVDTTVQEKLQQKNERWLKYEKEQLNRAPGALSGRKLHLQAADDQRFGLEGLFTSDSEDEIWEELLHEDENNVASLPSLPTFSTNFSSSSHMHRNFSFSHRYISTSRPQTPAGSMKIAAMSEGIPVGDDYQHIDDEILQNERFKDRYIFKTSEDEQIHSNNNQLLYASLYDPFHQLSQMLDNKKMRRRASIASIFSSNGLISAQSTLKNAPTINESSPNDSVMVSMQNNRRASNVSFGTMGSVGDMSINTINTNQGLSTIGNMNISTNINNSTPTTTPLSPNSYITGPLNSTPLLQNSGIAGVGATNGYNTMNRGYNNSSNVFNGGSNHFNTSSNHFNTASNHFNTAPNHFNTASNHFNTGSNNLNTSSHGPNNFHTGNIIMNFTTPQPIQINYNGPMALPPARHYKGNHIPTNNQSDNKDHDTKSSNPNHININSTGSMNIPSINSFGPNNNQGIDPTAALTYNIYPNLPSTPAHASTPSSTFPLPPRLSANTASNGTIISTNYVSIEDLHDIPYNTAGLPVLACMLDNGEINQFPLKQPSSIPPPTVLSPTSSSSSASSIIGGFKALQALLPGRRQDTSTSTANQIKVGGNNGHSQSLFTNATSATSYRPLLPALAGTLASHMITGMGFNGFPHYPKVQSIAALTTQLENATTTLTIKPFTQRPKPFYDIPQADYARILANPIPEYSDIVALTASSPLFKSPISPFAWSQCPAALTEIFTQCDAGLNFLIEAFDIDIKGGDVSVMPISRDAYKIFGEANLYQTVGRWSERHNQARINQLTILQNTFHEWTRYDPYVDINSKHADYWGAVDRDAWKRVVPLPKEGMVIGVDRATELTQLFELLHNVFTLPIKADDDADELLPSNVKESFKLLLDRRAQAVLLAETCKDEEEQINMANHRIFEQSRSLARYYSEFNQLEQLRQVLVFERRMNLDPTGGRYALMAKQNKVNSMVIAISEDQIFNLILSPSLLIQQQNGFSSARNSSNSFSTMTSNTRGEGNIVNDDGINGNNTTPANNFFNDHEHSINSSSNSAHFDITTLRDVTLTLRADRKDLPRITPGQRVFFFRKVVQQDVSNLTGLIAGPEDSDTNSTSRSSNEPESRESITSSIFSRTKLFGSSSSQATALNSNEQRGVVDLITRISYLPSVWSNVLPSQLVPAMSEMHDIIMHMGDDGSSRFSMSKGTSSGYYSSATSASGSVNSFGATNTNNNNHNITTLPQHQHHHTMSPIHPGAQTEKWVLCEFGGVAAKLLRTLDKREKAERSSKSSKNDKKGHKGDKKQQQKTDQQAIVDAIEDLIQHLELHLQDLYVEIESASSQIVKFHDLRAENIHKRYWKFGPLLAKQLQNIETDRLKIIIDEVTRVFLIYMQSFIYMRSGQNLPHIHIWEELQDQGRMKKIFGGHIDHPLALLWTAIKSFDPQDLIARWVLQFNEPFPSHLLLQVVPPGVSEVVLKRKMGNYKNDKGDKKDKRDKKDNKNNSDDEEPPSLEDITFLASRSFVEKPMSIQVFDPTMQNDIITNSKKQRKNRFYPEDNADIAKTYVLDIPWDESRWLTHKWTSLSANNKANHQPNRFITDPSLHLPSKVVNEWYSRFGPAFIPSPDGSLTLPTLATAFNTIFSDGTNFTPATFPSGTVFVEVTDPKMYSLDHFHNQGFYDACRTNPTTVSIGPQPQPVLSQLPSSVTGVYDNSSILNGNGKGVIDDQLRDYVNNGYHDKRMTGFPAAPLNFPDHNQLILLKQYDPITRLNDYNNIINNTIVHDGLPVSSRSISALPYSASNLNESAQQSHASITISAAGFAGRIIGNAKNNENLIQEGEIFSTHESLYLRKNFLLVQALHIPSSGMTTKYANAVLPLFGEDPNAHGLGPNKKLPRNRAKSEDKGITDDVDRATKAAKKALKAFRRNSSSQSPQRIAKNGTLVPGTLRVTSSRPSSPGIGEMTTPTDGQSTSTVATIASTPLPTGQSGNIIININPVAPSVSGGNIQIGTSTALGANTAVVQRGATLNSAYQQYLKPSHFSDLSHHQIPFYQTISPMQSNNNTPTGTPRLQGQISPQQYGQITTSPTSNHPVHNTTSISNNNPFLGLTGTNSILAPNTAVVANNNNNNNKVHVTIYDRFDEMAQKLVKDVTEVLQPEASPVFAFIPRCLLSPIVLSESASIGQTPRQLANAFVSPRLNLALGANLMKGFSHENYQFWMSVSTLSMTQWQLGSNATFSNTQQIATLLSYRTAKYREEITKHYRYHDEISCYSYTHPKFKNTLKIPQREFERGIEVILKLAPGRLPKEIKRQTYLEQLSSNHFDLARCDQPDPDDAGPFPENHDFLSKDPAIVTALHLIRNTGYPTPFLSLFIPHDTIQANPLVYMTKQKEKDTKEREKFNSLPLSKIHHGAPNCSTHPIVRRIKVVYSSPIYTLSPEAFVQSAITIYNTHISPTASVPINLPAELTTPLVALFELQIKYFLEWSVKRFDAVFTWLRERERENQPHFDPLVVFYCPGFFGHQHSGLRHPLLPSNLPIIEPLKICIHRNVLTEAQSSIFTLLGRDAASRFAQASKFSWAATNREMGAVIPHYNDKKEKR